MSRKQNVLTVSEFVGSLKLLIDSYPSFKNVAIIGELSNFTAHHSGHFYFTLKDDKSRISCVMFRSKASSVLFKPKNGDKVIVVGSAEVFESAGTVQIYASRMNLDGLGDLYVQFEALKKDYQDKGYFKPEHKKAFPAYPTSIGVIVGDNSAAYYDISRTLMERWPLAKRVDLLAYVQGESAVPSIVERLHEANSMNLDCIILGRGGGSIEDLWAFNSPEVIEAIFSSKIPIATGIGHESDTTLADFVSDYRAATPTAAAVHVTPNQYEISEVLRNYKNKYYSLLRNKILDQKSMYQSLVQNSNLRNPEEYIEKKSQKLDYLQNRILNQSKQFEVIHKELLRYDLRFNQALQMRYQNLNHRLTLNRNMLVNQVDQVIKTSRILANNKQQKLLNAVDMNLRLQENKKHQLFMLNRQFSTVSQRVVNLKKKELMAIIKAISVQNPAQKMLELFDKGYARITQELEPIKSIHSIDIDSPIKIELKDGSVEAKVIGKDIYDKNI